METIDSAFFAPQRPQYIAPASKKRSGVFVVSVIIHAGLVFALAVFESKRDIPQTVTPPPITATLIQLPKPEKAATPNPGVPVVETEPTTPAQPEMKASPEPAKKVVKEDTAPEKANTAARSKIDSTSIKPESTKTSPASTNAPESVVEAKAKADTSRRALSSRRSLDAFFSQQQAQAQQRDAEQAAREYRKAKTSPELVDPRKGEMKEDPRLVGSPPPVNADCSSTTTKSLAFISQFTGGRVTCSDRGNGFEKFIDARINKGVKEEEKQN